MEMKNELKSFIMDNNIIGTMAGVAIALYTKDLILSLSGDVIIPLLNKFLLKLNVKFITDILPHKVKFNITTFFQNFISWVLGIVITYIFIQYAVKKLFGISKEDGESNKESDTKKESDTNNR